MSIRIRYDQDVWPIVAFVLFVAFLLAVGPFWFPIGVTGSIERG